RDITLLALGTIRAETAGFVPIDEGISKYNTDPGQHPFNRYDHMSALGNQGPPDGERYRGRGFIQLTGRANYRTYGTRLGVPLENQPDRANDPEIAAGVLAAFLADKRTAAKYAIFGNDLAFARKLVNGGSHGLERFQVAFEKGASLLA
ncbi:MAG: peptidoglycan-binding protein, partial [Pseudomonadota bacterium]